jgi:hypothetical protein
VTGKMRPADATLVLPLRRSLRNARAVDNVLTGIHIAGYGDFPVLAQRNCRGKPLTAKSGEILRREMLLARMVAFIILYRYRECYRNGMGFP